MKIRELETELKRSQRVNNGSIMDELPDGHQKAEYLRAKQDMVNRIVRMEEKNREVERNVKRMQEDEIALINDFYTVISKLDYQEKVKLIRETLRNLENDKQKSSLIGKEEKSDSDEKFDKTSENNESGNLKSDIQDSLMSNREAELSRKILELQDENKNLNVSIEELDRQHTESIEELLSLKEDIEKKHQCLQNAYEQLYVDYNQAEGKVLELQSKLGSIEERNKSIFKKESLEREEKNVQTEERENIKKKGRKDNDDDDDDDDNDNNDSLYGLEQRVKEILKNSCIETSESNESIFETVARRYVETNWKKDVLERKVTEITRNLKETTEMRDNLQLECDDMQTHIDSLLLNIQHLKLNLPSIPEASEERVASLETETESLQEEVKRLREENDTLRRLNVTELMIPRLENGEIHLEENFIDEEKVIEIEHSDIRREEDSVEDLKRRLLEFSNETSELRTSLEKYKETIEELRLGKENIAHELKASVYSMEELERELKVTLDVKNELERENGDLIKENEEYRADLARFKETADDAKKEENDLLEKLREKLEKVNVERNDLEYDLLNMRKELDNALHEADERQELIAQLSQENEKFTRENTSLLDQLTASQVESQEKIELLNTEKSLLEEEQSELRSEVATYKEKIQQLADTENKCAMINYELEIARKRINELLSENEGLYGQLEKIHELEKELNEKKAAANDLHSLRNKFIETEAELNSLRLKEKEIAAKELNLLQSKFMETEAELNDLRLREKEMSQVQGDDYNEIVVLRDTVTDLNDKIRLSEEKCKQLESFVTSLESETKEKMLLKENSFENERQKLTDSLKEKSEENEGLKDINNKLTMEIIEMKSHMESSIEANKENATMAKETIESLSHLIKEKDNEIESLKAMNDRANAANSNDLLTIRNERDELVKLVHIKHNESIQYHSEIQRLTQLLNEQVSQVRNLLTEQNQITTLLKDKDTELAGTRNELQTLQQRLENIKDVDNNGEVCRIAGHLTQIQEMAILNDKCNALEAALIQEQSNNRMLQNQFVESQSKEANAGKELERLRTHLVEIESSYTEEALLAEEMRKELEGKLLQAEEKLKNSSTVYTSASIRANQQVETLQQQMSLIIQQRDDIQNKLSMAEDKVLSQTTALTNLQIVLEQFQREKERDIKRVTEKLQLQLQESHKKQEELLNEISCLKEQLAEAQEYLQAASRLSEQLDKKTERIEQLNQEVERLMELVNTADQRIEEAMQSGVGKVDKNLMKNLLLGYLSSSTADKSSVLRVFATVLDFTEHDRDKAGLNNGIANNSWFSRLSGGNGAPTKDQEASLSAAFVRFLESESKPKPQLPALPISSSSSPRPTHSRQHSTSSSHSTLLLSNITLPTFPDFVPARNTGSILKEVLKDS